MNYISSYTHGGSYYTLPHVIEFNSNGLWYYKGIGFSRYGNLQETLVQFITQSTDGKTQEELRHQLNIRTHNSLLKLVKLNKISRRRVHDVFVYLSADLSKANRQIHNRNKTSLAWCKGNFSDWVIIEILLEIIRVKELQVDGLQIVSNLNARGVTVTFTQVEQVLKNLHIKKLRI